MNRITPYQSAALKYNEHISLTANAGSGKTFVLSRRFVEIAVNENLSLRNLVAITFTEKAASELFKKISDEVERRLDISSNADEKEKLERIRRQLVSANISTIHAFCINILKEFPSEAKIDANFVPIDKAYSDELIQLSVEEIISASLKQPGFESEIKYLIRLFGSKNLLAAELINLVDKRKNILALADKLYSKNEEEIAGYFRTIYIETSKALFDEKIKQLILFTEEINIAVLSKDAGNKIALEINSIILKLKQQNDFNASLALIHTLVGLLLTKSGTVLQKGYLGKNKDTFTSQISFIEETMNDLADFSVMQDDNKLELDLARFGKVLISVFKRILERYEDKKHLNGYLDFEDILIKTKMLLSSSEIGDKLFENYKYIMVDEYQDTNEIQFDIIMPILDYLSRGNLFIVGDEKQSIYMFRDAELEVFNRTKELISEDASPEKLLMLPHSFRMSPDICLFTNIVFSKLFENPNRYFNDVEYNELVCSRDDNVEGNIEFIISDADSSEDSEAVLVAKRIKQLVTGVDPTKYKYDDFTILCRKRKSFDEIEDAFTLLNIPYTIVGGKGFYQQQVIYDIYNYLNFLINVKNDAALVGVLRSPFFTISDAEIFEISLEEGENYWDKFINYSKSKNRLTQVLKILNENIELAWNIDIPILVKKIIEDTGYLAVIAAGPRGKHEIASIEKLVRISNSFFNQGLKSLYDFVKFLEDATSNRVDEGEPGISLLDDSVKLMTLHQSKGLEFKAVVLYNSQEHSAVSTVKAKTIQADKDYGLLTSLPADSYFSRYQNAPVVSLYNYITRKKNNAETKRQLYVGITRAKDLLIVSGSKKNSDFHKDSYLGLLAAGLENELDQEINLAGELQFLKYEKDQFQSTRKSIRLTIPVINQIEFSDNPELKENEKEIVQLKDKTAGISDVQEEEIISATKVAVYNQCPVKYYLTYELGYLDIYVNYKRSLKDFDFYNSEEKEHRIMADIKGKIVHTVLEKESNSEDQGILVDSLLSNEKELQFQSAEAVEKLKQNILETAGTYYSSVNYKTLKRFTNYFNEYKIYAKEKDYFLYGIIDKLVIENDSALIVDYKTDNIAKDEIPERFEQYKTQLLFYAYLVGRSIPKINKFILQIIFLSYPDDVFKIELKREELIQIKNLIKEFVSKTRNVEYVKNLSHCSKCVYSKNDGTCVKT
ncbi:MAG: hypothetical protein C4539_05990 [Ignavibacteriales bacterium]|nr:MAG: hypothetical protein C4539_05990 [Ignavibacteriales bacterium]